MKITHNKQPVLCRDCWLNCAKTKTSCKYYANSEAVTKGDFKTGIFKKNKKK